MSFYKEDFDFEEWVMGQVAKENNRSCQEA